MTRDMNESKTGRLRGHSVAIDNRSRAVFTGVTDVDSFNEEEVILATEAGVITLFGQGLHISHLNLDQGQLIVEGEIDAMDYTQQSPKKRGPFGWLLK